jgi:hypothetical protein
MPLVLVVFLLLLLLLLLVVVVMMNGGCWPCRWCRDAGGGGQRWRWRRRLAVVAFEMNGGWCETHARSVKSS